MGSTGSVMVPSPQVGLSYPGHAPTIPQPAGGGLGPGERCAVRSEGRGRGSQTSQALGLRCQPAAGQEVQSFPAPPALAPGPELRL